MANSAELNSAPDYGELNLFDSKAFLQAQEEEHCKIKRMVNFSRNTDELDCSVHPGIENILSTPISFQSSIVSMSNLENRIHGFPTPEQLIDPKYCRRLTLNFRFIRRCLELHLVNLVDEEAIFSVKLSEEEKEDFRLSEQIWFFLFIGAQAPHRTESLRLFSEQNS